MESKVYKLYGPRELVLESEPVQRLSSTEIFAETLITALSPGTELGAYSGASPLRSGAFYPRVVGYCNLSEIKEIGNEVRRFQKGDRILTFQSHRDSFKMDQEDFALKVPSQLNAEQAVTAYLYHLGYHSLLTGDVRSGHRVAVIGAGVLGITSAFMADVSGCLCSVYSDQNGVSPVFEGSSIQVKRKSELSDDCDFDVIINTSNTWDDWRLCLRLVRKGGTIVNLGFPGRDQKLPDFNPLEPQFVYAKGLTIKALGFINDKEVPAYEDRFNNYRNLEFIMNLMLSRKLDPKRIISDEISYEHLSGQYEKYLNRSTLLLTTLLRWK